MLIKDYIFLFETTILASYSVQTLGGKNHFWRLCAGGRPGRYRHPVGVATDRINTKSLNFLILIFERINRTVNYTLTLINCWGNKLPGSASPSASFPEGPFDW